MLHDTDILFLLSMLLHFGNIESIKPALNKHTINTESKLKQTSVNGQTMLIN